MIQWTDKAKQDVKDHVCSSQNCNSHCESFRYSASKRIRGQTEPFLSHLKKEYRRLVIANYKIIYSIRKDYVAINAVFDSRRSPKKMKVR